MLHLITRYFLYIPVIAVLISCNTKRSQPYTVTVKIFLEDSVARDTIADMRFLHNFSYVKQIDFLSKDDASNEYLKEDSNDWRKVLTENPFPASYNLEIDGNKFFKKDIEPFVDAVMKNIPGCSDIAYPEELIKKER